MGLDAWVWCNCIETEQLYKPHPFPELLYIDEEGGPSIRSDDDDKISAHYEWLDSAACPHEYRTLVHHYLGNIALIGTIRHVVDKLAEHASDEYPVLWQQVIYSGTHCGDWLSIQDVEQLHARWLSFGHWN